MFYLSHPVKMIQTLSFMCVTMCATLSLFSHVQPFQKGDGRIQGHEFDIGTATWDRPIFYSYHGTHVVGTMMAQGNNNQGSRGIIPQARDDGVCLLVARVFGDGPMASAKTSTVEMAAEWCADQGAQVINLS
jgi:subtilisin family serine protease